MKIPVTQKGTVPVKWVESRQRWQVATYVDGRQRRRFFREEAAAVRCWVEHLRTIGRFGKHAAAFDAKAQREYDEARRLAGGKDLRDVAREWASVFSARSVSMASAVDSFLEAQSKRKLAADWLRRLRKVLEAFCAVHGAKNLAAVSSGDVLDWLLSLKLAPKTLSNRRRLLGAFFSWCDRRGLCASPVRKVTADDLPAIPSEPKEILSVEQCAALMSHLERAHPGWVVWFALKLFAGWRNSEASRFRPEWSDCQEKVLVLPGWTDGELMSKTGDPWRLEGLPDNLFGWLARYREGQCAPSEREFGLLRRNELPDIGIPAWPHNACRHTFCTMLISLHGDAGKVANWSRHTSPATLYKHYCTKLVPRAEAVRYCAILPVFRHGV
jgi:hypothetical protein